MTKLRNKYHFYHVLMKMKLDMKVHISPFGCICHNL